ncbi:type VI secretion protein [Klebsiella pneumoniae]|nr:type VI secretion protein [Klebsiella pneumoniae]
MNPYAFARIRGWAFRLAKSVEWTILNRPVPPAVRVTFMGLYGVESPLPTHYSDDIAQRREGVEATEDFLDIFNHRLIAQYYRILAQIFLPGNLSGGRHGQHLAVSAGPGGAGHTGMCRRCRSAAVAISGAAAGDDAAGEIRGRHGGAGGASWPRDPGDGVPPRSLPDPLVAAVNDERPSAGLACNIGQ